MSQSAGIPTYVDTHAHLDDGRFDGDLDAVLAMAAKVGVRRVVNIGYRPLRWASSIALAKRNSAVSFTLGLHPHHADEFDDVLLRELAVTIETQHPVALGEIGLDYFRDFADRGNQRRAFAAQLELAEQSRLPVVIHMRGDVENDLKCELERTSRDLVCILHSFDGSRELADYARVRGFLFGAGGLVTRGSNTQLRAIVRDLPLESILLETDAPYLTPAGVKDRRNSPVNIPLIATAVARLKGVSVEEVAAATSRNAMRVFGLSLETPDEQAEMRP